MSQQKYVRDIVSEMNLLDAKSAPTPLPIGDKLSKDDGQKFEKLDQYRRLIGRVLYLTITRLDIWFFVQQLNQFMS